MKSPIYVPESERIFLIERGSQAETAEGFLILPYDGVIMSRLKYLEMQDQIDAALY